MRPKVHPDKRQRTASACDVCKRRKQKCDGQQPCLGCSRRSERCSFSTASPDQSRSPQVRSMVARQSGGPRDMAGSRHGEGAEVDFIGKLPVERPKDGQVEGLAKRKSLPDGNDDDAEEEAENHTMTRLLEDSQGRLVFVGDSATLSFLQLLRMIVETVDGSSMFTSDPKRHRIEETQFAIDMHSDLSHLLPDRRTARILVDAFFTHTHGFIDLFDETKFMAELTQAYEQPLSVTTKAIARIHLILAVGMCLAIPRPGTVDQDIIEDIRRRFPDQSEIYYLVAGRIKDSLREMEEADIWTIQSLVLMAFYMLLRTRRSLAYAYTGMAIRSAFALGMHRDETNDIFPEDERTERKRLWRTLFVLDRFMSVSLGRPLAISADMAYGETLHPSTAHFIGTNLSTDQLRYAALAASIESAHTMGAVLSKIYQEGKISTRVAQGFSDRCKQWPCKLTPQLHWRNARSDNVRVAIAILHCNLMFCHSIILLTRPFFLYVLSSEMQQSQLDLDNLEPNSRGKIGRFSDACILASFHTIALVQTAYAGQYLPRLNPLSSYCLFTCGLIVAANEFARPGRHDAADSSICNAMSILQYCGTLDPHAKEAARVLTNFRDVIRKRAQQAAPKSQSSTTKPSTAKATYQPSSLQPPPVPALASDVCAAPSLSSFEGMDTLFSDPAIFDLLGPSVDVLPNADTSLSSSQDTPFNLDDLRQWPFWTSQPSPSVPVQPRAPVGPSVIPAHWQGPVPKSSSSNTDARSTPYPFLQ